MGVKGRIEKSQTTAGDEYIIGADVGGYFQPAPYAKKYKTRKGAERELKRRGWI